MSEATQAEGHPLAPMALSTRLWNLEKELRDFRYTLSELSKHLGGTNAAVGDALNQAAQNRAQCRRMSHQIGALQEDLSQIDLTTVLEHVERLERRLDSHRHGSDGIPAEEA